MDAWREGGSWFGAGRALPTTTSVSQSRSGDLRSKKEAREGNTHNTDTHKKSQWLLVVRQERRRIVLFIDRSQNPEKGRAGLQGID